MSKTKTISRELIRALRKVELFGALSGDDLKRFAEAGQIMGLGPGDTLFSPSDPPDRIHLILEGVRQIRGTSTSQVEAAALSLVTSGAGVPTSALLLARP